MPTAAVWLRLVHALQVSPLEAALAAFVDGESRCRRVIALADELLDQGLARDARWVAARAEALDRDAFGHRYRGELRRVWGRVAMAEHNYPTACRCFEHVVKNASQGCRHRQAVAAYDYGVALMSSGRAAAGLEQLGHARSLSAGDTDPQMLGRLDWAAGTLFFRLGDYHSARASYQRACERFGGTPVACFPRFGWLLCSMALGDPPGDVLKELVVLAQHAPGHLRPRIQHRIGVVARRNGHPDQALYWFDRALAGSPASAAEWCNTQCERLLCLVLVQDAAGSRDLWTRLRGHCSQLDDHDTLALTVLAKRWGLASPSEWPARMHKEPHRGAAVEWAWLV